MTNPTPNSISLDGKTHYQKGARFLLIPARLNQSFTPMVAVVESLDGYSAWLTPELKSSQLPSDEELFLVEFQGRYVFTHRTRISKRRDGGILVAPPSLTEKELSQLAPATGRNDYRVQVKVPIQIRFLQEKPGASLMKGTLCDLSRGGMSFQIGDKANYLPGQEINMQVVSWEYPVNIDAVVVRTSGDRVALSFKEQIDDRQREMISAFIIQVQRRDALARSLPSES